MKSRILSGLFSLALCVGGASAFAADWPAWRGPEQNGVSREKDLPDEWEPDGKNMLWKNDVGGMSSPIVMNGKVFAMSRTGETALPDTMVASPRTQERAVCMDANTGRVLWEYRESPTQTEVPFHRLGWGNMVGDPKTGRVYAYFVHCSLVCFDAETGKIIWKRQLTEEFGAISTFGGRTSSPAIDEDQIFVAGVSFGFGEHARSQHRIYCFDKETGELRWSNGTGGIPVDSPYNTPSFGTINGERLVVFSGGDGGVHAFQARTGKKAWTYRLSKRGLNSSVLIDGNRIYATSSEENVDTPVMGRIVCLDAGDGTPKLVWKKDGIEAGFPSHTLADRRYYVLDNGGGLYAFDANDGKQYWRKKVGTIGKASLVYADGKIYVPEANGRFTVVKPEENKAEIVYKTEVPEKQGREYAIFGSVAIANGRVYLQTANTMYAIGPKEPQVAADPIPAPVNKEEPVDPATAKVAHVQVRPYDAALKPGETQQFKAFAFDEKGRALGPAKDVKWSVGQLMNPAPPSAPQGTPPTPIGNLQGEVNGEGLFKPAGGPQHQGGAVVADVSGVKGYGRTRVFPPLPWKFDFQQAPVDRPPLTWLGAGGKFAVKEEENAKQAGNKALVKLLDLDLYYRARTNLGTVDMSNYTIQADVKAGKKVINDQNQIPDPGVINQRYVLVLLGNHQRLQIHTWPSALPYALHQEIPFEWKPDTWYTMKLRVEQASDRAIVRGKVWPQGSPEPEQWTLELQDPMPNKNGNPGLFGHSLVGDAKSFIWYDNILVTDNK